ncbi:MAG TPA: RQC-minor-1 family DNA-binding protein [Woeseiaceae bacterium]|nr:RQC-minor-1 family DNA-binding protein [Woeseiaceae bacterium]
MRRKSRRAPIHLDAKGLSDLPEADLHAVLRGADDLIGQGGRTLLKRLLRGSKNKDILARGLENSPVYGYFKDLSDEEALARIDWTILNGYLRVEQFDRLPLIVYTQKGWEIERENYADELLAGFDKLIQEGPPFDMEYLKDRDRPMILRLLDKIEATGDPRYVPLLVAWKTIDYKKVQFRIRDVIRRLEQVRL